MSDYGLKITQVGKDITSTTPSDYVIWSKYQVPKTYIVGTASISLANESATQSNHSVTIPHGLGYIPLTAFFWSTSTQMSGGFWSHGVAGGHNTFSFVTFHITSSNLIINYTYDNLGGGDGQTTIAPITWNFKYYIFIDQGQ